MRVGRPGHPVAGVVDRLADDRLELLGRLVGVCHGHGSVHSDAAALTSAAVLLLAVWAATPWLERRVTLGRDFDGTPLPADNEYRWTQLARVDRTAPATARILPAQLAIVPPNVSRALVLRELKS